ncbi:type II secretion system F family protein [Schaalia vaccimaxillae]|uniref:type II secretion system F family protein n=1 Tax=Schaalia vaccimaxillae TaxID=183916 RepID=UPI0003B35C75|nr:type II secretion system F family protein [Schaalia vaccimaxillae]
MNALMSSLVVPAIVGIVGASGIFWLIGAVDARRPNLARRVAQGAVQPGRTVARDSTDTVAWINGVLEALGSTTSSVQRRLQLLGQNEDVGPFRLQQLICSVTCMAVTVAALIPVLASRGLSGMPVVIVSGAIGALAGCALWDRVLTWRATSRQKRIELQVPDASELLSLAVGAGESIPNALERVASISTFDLATELSQAVADMKTGSPSTRVLAELSARNNSAALDRLCQTLITSIERGAPLAQVLHDQARDIRESSRQALMEEGGKREIAMLFPVIFLILPVTILFALYPGLMALDISP